MNYCQRLKDFREDNGLTQADVAKVISTTYQYYSTYEGGKREIPFYRMVEIARAFDISLDYLGGLIDEPIRLTERKKESIYK